MARHVLGALVAVGFALAIPLSSSAQDDWATSLYSAGGAELRVDERVFTLFAALNELGYDNAPVTRLDPIPKREFDPVRRAVRDAAGMEPALRGKFEAFFDKNPLPVRSYLTYALALGPAPTFKAPEAPPAGTEPLKGFEALLQEFHTKAKIGSMFHRAVEVHRDAMRAWSAVVDKPLAEAREALGVVESDDSPMNVVVVNLLDGKGASFGIPMGEDLFLVVGPPGKEPDASTVARAFARAEVIALAKGKGRNLKNGESLLQEIRGSGFPVEAANIDDFVAENLARVIAIKASVPAAERSKALEEEYWRGFVLVKELHRGLAIFAVSKNGKPLEQFIADFLREIDTAKLLASLKGS
jgi:hypothetical protein